MTSQDFSKENFHLISVSTAEIFLHIFQEKILLFMVVIKYFNIYQAIPNFLA